MAAATRSKKSTLANSLQTMRSVSEILQPTAVLNEVEMTHFQRVVTSREADTWAPHDLSIATQLAKMVRRFEELQEQLDRDGLTFMNERGALIAHPLLAGSMQMSNTIQALSRTLGLGASQRGVAGAAQASRNKAEQTARKVIERASADDLLT